MINALHAEAIRMLRARGVRDGLIPLGPGGLSLFYAARPAPLQVQVYAPTICLVLQGRKALTWDGRTRMVGPGEPLLVGGDLAVDVTIAEAPYLAVSVALDPSLLRELAAEAPGPIHAGLPVDLPLQTEAQEGVVGAMARLVALTAQPRAQMALAPLALRELHWWLLESAQGPMLRDLAREDGRGARVARAVALIRANLARPLKVADLARVAGMSPSAFHQHFRAVTASTPIQFQKRLRLLEAQARLRGGSAVGPAAFAVGYESPTQFSRDYARAFGHPPREDRPRGDEKRLAA